MSRKLCAALLVALLLNSTSFAAGVFPHGTPAEDGPEWSRRITVPAGQIYRFDYSFHGDHNMGITIWDDTNKELLKFDGNWRRPGDVAGFVFTNRNSNKEVTYIVNGFGKDCWAEKTRCSRLPWFQEKVVDLGQNNFGFTAQNFGNRVHINFNWSRFE